jgi:cytochrome c oxidase subunit 2
MAVSNGTALKGGALGALVAGGVLAPQAAALADGKPHEWEIGFQKAASPVMEELTWFHNDLLLPIIIAITAFVLFLLLYVMWRFSEKRHPTPSRTTHNSLIEILWTVIPVIILIVIAVPSFKLLYFADHAKDPEMTLKAIGHQWYWSYEYPDQGDFTFDALLVPEKDLKEGQPRLLTTDNDVVLPINTDIRVLVTATDVIHSFAMPSMGVKMDAVPGRTNETWLRVEEEGMYYGQCSELCGTGHAFMPIAIKAVSKEDFKTWVEQAKQKFARADEPGRRTNVAQLAVDK